MANSNLFLFLTFAKRNDKILSQKFLNVSPTDYKQFFIFGHEQSFRDGSFLVDSTSEFPVIILMAVVQLAANPVLKRRSEFVVRQRDLLPDSSKKKIAETSPNV